MLSGTPFHFYFVTIATGESFVQTDGKIILFLAEKTLVDCSIIIYTSIKNNYKKLKR